LERKLAFINEHKHVLALYRSWRFWVWWSVASIPAVGAVLYRAWSSAFPGFPVWVGLIIGMGFCVGGLQSVFRGHVITNTGIYVRRAEPVRFWGSIAFFAAMYGVAIFAILKV
jgi:hypothetical protein